MKQMSSVIGFMAAMCLLPSAPAAAQQKGSLAVPVVGTFADGGEFKGTANILRFEERDNAIVAIGFVNGVLSRQGQALGTGLTGLTAWPVVVRAGGVSPAVHQGRSGVPGPAVAEAGIRPASTVVPAQAPACPALSINLGPHVIDVLGLQVALSPVVLEIGGVPGTPLGELTCAALALLTNVARLVNVLNNILFLLVALLGGLFPIGGPLPVGLVAGIG